MSFKRDGKSVHEARRAWAAFRATHAAALAQTGLPECVLRTRDDWAYFLKFGYHCAGAYPNMDFSVEELTERQQDALRRLLDAVLTPEEKARGNAVWHHPRGTG